jgi:hypothetical protein
MTTKTDKLETQKCHHCGHEWEPRVKKPKKCPQCQNPLWVSPRPKRQKNVSQTSVKRQDVTTPIAASEEAVPIPPTTDTNGEGDLSDVFGVEPLPEPEPTPPESPVTRLQREAEERLRRLADQPID